MIHPLPIHRRAVERAYSELKARGELDHQAFDAAVAVMRERQPDCPRDTAVRLVSEIVFNIIAHEPGWFWRDASATA